MNTKFLFKYLLQFKKKFNQIKKQVSDTNKNHIFQIKQNNINIPKHNDHYLGTI